MMNLLNNPNIFSKSKLQNNESNGTLKVFIPCMFDKSIFSEKKMVFIYIFNISDLKARYTLLNKRIIKIFLLLFCFISKEECRVNFQAINLNYIVLNDIYALFCTV